MAKGILQIILKWLGFLLWKTIVVYFLWNWIVPDLFLCGCDISFLQSLGMVFMFSELTYWHFKPNKEQQTNEHGENISRQ